MAVNIDARKVPNKSGGFAPKILAGNKLRGEDNGSERFQWGQILVREVNSEQMTFTFNNCGPLIALLLKAQITNLERNVEPRHQL